MAAGRFTARHAQRDGGVFLSNAATYPALIANRRGLSAGPGGSDMDGWLMRALGRAYILGRHNLTLLVYASETALFQGMLARASDAAAPAPVWPDSPAVATVASAEPTGAR